MEIETDILTPVYLRDLTEEARRGIEEHMSPVALNAVIEGEDIVVGYYLDRPKVVRA